VKYRFLLSGWGNWVNLRGFRRTVILDLRISFDETGRLRVNKFIDGIRDSFNYVVLKIDQI
jgi:hypothetical protein